MRFSAFLIALTLIISATQASAYGGFCTEPVPPSCINAFGTFDDEWSFDRCKRDVESYLSEVDEFTACLVRWNSRVGEEASSTVKRFNCKAKGDSFCP